MEPEAYRNFKNIGFGLPPLIPVDEEPRIVTPAEKDWTVYSMDATRGPLVGTYIDPKDPRQQVGWAADERAGEHKPWMWTPEQPMFKGSDGADEHDSEATPRATKATSDAAFPHPDLSLPHPTLSLDFRMSVMLNPLISVGATPFGGHRNWISFSGGTWSGSWGNGTVLPGGQDNQVRISDGSMRMETSYLLQTNDNPPAYITIKTCGWRTGPPEILQMLADPKVADGVDPNRYKMRLFIEMETGDERYKDKLNCGMWIGSGMRKGAEVIYDAYRLS
ncbi:hypothetical protein B0O99DRAFT_301677 [Bisporella sp. PMI_857]|nr:hypothetical protein B0O99DRAFT_301677 [Bisporella sp. PMI_857]